MLLVTTFSFLFSIIFTISLVNADPQPPLPHQQGPRPIYITPQGQQLPRQPQYQTSFGPGGPPPPPQSSIGSYRPQNSYIINSTPKPIPHQQQLPSPSPVQPPRPQQLSINPSRQGPPSSSSSSGSSSSASSNRYSSPLGEVQAVYQGSPSYAGPPQNNRNRFQPSPQQQSKYSSQLKVGGPGGPQGSKQNQLTSEEAEYEDEETQEPDRLTLLLQESKFQCSGKKDGYYADEGLGCEVFHYCQDNTKHSWMCPNNFAFHQVHLICVPQSSDNICKQSSNYHFVNEYLYRPVNEKEAQATNTSLKYADRYYPDGYTPGLPLDEMLANYDSSQAHIPAPRAPPSFKQQHHHNRPQAYGGSGSHSGERNVFFSPESINIPLSQRRPAIRGGGGGGGSPGLSAKAATIQQQQQRPKQNFKYEDEEYEDEY